MKKINLNESYLHKVIVSSINKLIKEDLEVSNVDYLKDIENGEVDDILYHNDNVEIFVVGESDKYNETGNESDTMAYYTIKCDVRVDEVSAGSVGDYYNPPEPSEYENYLDIISVSVSNDYIENKDISNEIDFNSLKSIVYDMIDWDNVDNVYTLKDRYWDSHDDRYEE
jgi:hypothetical protein